jgi:hypothetical protein
MISKIFWWISLVAALIALAMTIHLWCFLNTKVAPKVATTAPVAVVLGDTNNYYRKLDWDSYTNLCRMWLELGHHAASFGVPINLVSSNTIHILEKNRYP